MKYVIACPKCNSTDVQTDFSNPAMIQSGMFVNSRVCNNCGYKSDFFPEVEETHMHIIKKVKTLGKRELVNPKYYSNVNWLFRIIGPLGFIISLIFIFSTKYLLFVISLIYLLPLSFAILILSYKNTWIKKYKIINVVMAIILVYSFTIAPFLVYYFIFR